MKTMGTTLTTLAPPQGAKHRPKRLGRGGGSGTGTTAGRGEKGQGSRSGGKKGAGFEGGQMPLQRRLPKRGFKNPFRAEFTPVNLNALDSVFAVGDLVEPDTLKGRGLVPKKTTLIKVLGDGELKAALTIKAHAFSKSALEKIAAAGGTAVVIPRKATGPRKGS